MSKINATVVADNINIQGDRITSVLVTMPRIILAEVGTHRMLSKNSASSRAIPFEKMVEAVTKNPFIPIAWQKAHKGMQGIEYLTGDFEIQEAKATWLIARDKAIAEAINLNRIGVTKQLCNRLLEPFMWTTVLITGTDDGWNNFFDLRCPQYTRYLEDKNVTEIFRSRKAILKVYPENKETTYLDWVKFNKGQAEIHMMMLAEAIYDVMNESNPKELQPGEWHIPFENNIIKGMYNDDNWGEPQLLELVKISTAMAARTSYTIVGEEKEFGYDKQIELHDRMANQVPFHASPFEHCARAMTDDEYELYSKTKPMFPDMTEGGHIVYNNGWCRNYRGFIQYRELLENK